MAVDVHNMSDEEFNANFEKIMNNPNASIEGIDDVVDDNSTQQDVDTIEESDNTVEQPDDVDVLDSEEEPDEEPAEDSEEDGDEDSAKDYNETSNEADVDEADSVEEVKQVFNFDTMPKDELLPMDIKVNGLTTRATFNELVEGFKKGMNYTKNMQQIAPFRRSVGIMEDNGITEADLNLMVELKAGNKEAITKLLADSKIDPLDIDIESKNEYTPKDYGRQVVDVEMEQVQQEITSDTANVEAVKNALTTMPDDFYSVIEGDANALRNLHKDVASGIYQRVMPEVLKLQTLYGKTKPTLEMYIDVARRMSESARTEQQAVTEKPKPSTEQRAKAVSGTKKKAMKQSTSVAKAVEEMDDDEFAANFEKIMGRSADSFNY